MRMSRQKRQSGAVTAVWAALALTAANGPALAVDDKGEAAGPAATEAAPVPVVTDWLERAARTYQSEIAGKLSVAREADAAPGASAAPASENSAWSALQASVRAALDYIAFWVDRAYRAVGLVPPAATPLGLVGYDAGDFVEARRRAEEQWKKAVEVADAAAAEAAREARRAGATGDSPAEAERKRAEARKAELEKIKQDLDRRIDEGLEKLEAWEKAEQARKAEEAKAKAEAEEAARKAEEAEKEAEAKRRAEAETEKARADEARKAREAERKTREEKRVAEAAEKKRFAEARAADARLAETVAAARRKTEAERKAAAETYQAEMKAAEHQRLAAAEPKPDATPAAEPPSPAQTPDAAAKNEAVEQATTRLVEASPPEATPRPQKARADLRKSRGAGKQATRPSRREAAAHRKSKSKKARSRDARIHVVRRGETLWSISRRFLKSGHRYAAIYEANRGKIRNPDRISPGQRLYIPRA